MSSEYERLLHVREIVEDALEKAGVEITGGGFNFVTREMDTSFDMADDDGGTHSYWITMEQTDGEGDVDGES